MTLSLDAHHRPQECDLPGKTGILRRIHDRTDILVGARCFFGDAARRLMARPAPWQADENAFASLSDVPARI